MHKFDISKSKIIEILVAENIFISRQYFNPYWQIMENSSRNFSKIFIFWVVTQAVLLENSSSFFSKFQFWGVTQAVLLENSPIQIMTETL